MNRTLLVWGLGAWLVVLTAVMALLHPPGTIELDGARRDAFLALAVLAGAGWIAACRLVLTGALAHLPRRRVLVAVLAVAAALRALAWWGPPNLSSDIYRYVWDGRVQLAGINPYRYRPADDALRFLRDDMPAGPTDPAVSATIYPNINRAIEAPTAYPPVAQLLFAGVALVSSGVWQVKLLMLALEAAAVAAAIALLRQAGRSPALVVVYAWAPLPVWEFAGNGHIDAASLGFLALAILAASRSRQAAAGALLAAAALCKFLPLALGPALWRPLGRPAGRNFGDWRFPAAFAAICAGGYGCYIGVGWGVLGYLQGYGQEEGLASGAGIFWLRLIGLGLTGFGLTLPGWAGTTYLIVAALGLGALALWMLVRPLPEAPGPRALALGRRCLILAGAAMAVITPHYPWYLCWLPWLACLCPASAVFWLTAAAPLLYLDQGRGVPIWTSIVLIPSALLALHDLRRPPA